MINNNSGRERLDEIQVKDDAKDRTLILWGILVLAGLYLLGLLIGDLFYDKNFLTPEINHTIIGFIFGVMTTLATAIAGKKMSQMVSSSNKEGDKE
ncbi:MAG: hypothetical protein OXE50_16575 [Chloroflexi bacterium]|nr:hypothetical protein [Chloroflexota bacterium]